MFHTTRIHTFTTRGTESATHVWHRVASQPSWITRAALLTFLIVVGLPLFLLFLIAVLFAAIVFMVLALLYGVWVRLRGIFPRDDGRENVVIRRVE